MNKRQKQAGFVVPFLGLRYRFPPNTLEIINYVYVILDNAN